MAQHIEHEHSLFAAQSAESPEQELREALLRLSLLTESAPQDRSVPGLADTFSAFLDPESECFLDLNF